MALQANLSDITAVHLVSSGGTTPLESLHANGVKVWSAKDPVCSLNPILSWKLDGNMLDECGSNNGTGNPEFSTDNGVQVWDGAGNISGSIVSLSISKSANHSTIAGWIKTSSASTSMQDILSIRSGGNNVTLVLRCDGSNVIVRTDSGTSTVGSKSTFDGVWKYAILTCSGSTQTVNVNGVDVPIGNRSTSTTIGSFSIGAGDSISRKFVGKIANVLFLDRVLSESEKQELWNIEKDNFPH